MWVEPRWAKQEMGGAAGPRCPNPPRGVALHQFECRALVNALSAQGDLTGEESFVPGSGERFLGDAGW